MRARLLLLLTVLAFLAPPVWAESGACARIFDSGPQISHAQVQEWLAQGKAQEAAWYLKRNGDLRGYRRIENGLEHILQNDKVIKLEEQGWGSTETYKVRFSSGVIGLFKPKVDHWRLKHRDFGFLANVRAEVDAYRIDRALELGVVPVTVETWVEGMSGSLQVFVRGAGSPKMSKMTQAIQILDYLINNRDRHGDNLLSVEGQLVAIDHGASFRKQGDTSIGHFEPPGLHEIKFEESLRPVYRNLVQRLTADKIREILKGRHGKDVVEETIERRNRLEKAFRKALGEP